MSCSLQLGGPCLDVKVEGSSYLAAVWTNLLEVVSEFQATQNLKVDGKLLFDSVSSPVKIKRFH